MTPIGTRDSTSRRALGRGLLPDNFTRSLYKLSPYQGCSHGCRYCDGRAERYYVEGDYERDIVTRDYLPDALASELPKLREPGMIAIGSGTTDPYQRIEAEVRIVGRCAEHLAESRLPVTVMTKSDLILRDLPFWKRVNASSRFVLLVSITTLDEEVRTVFEPGASSVEARLSTLRAFKNAGCAVGVLAMPFLPGITDDDRSIRALYSELVKIGVDFIMPGGLTLRPGRQKDFYINTLCSNRPDLVESTRALYREDRPSGRPIAEAERKLLARISNIQREFDMPFLLPHAAFAKALPGYDAFRILLRDMAELYDVRGVDVRPLRKSADRYDTWLAELKHAFRRKRSLPSEWLQERVQEAARGEELHKTLDNERLTRFARDVLLDGAVFNYRTLTLSPPP